MGDESNTTQCRQSKRLTAGVAGHKSGSEAVIHAMHNIFDANGIDAVLLVDASNALNSSAADFWSVQLIRLGPVPPNIMQYAG